MLEQRSDRSGLGKWRLAVWTAIAGLLLLPYVAMQFTEEVRWDAADFAAAGLLLGAVGIGLELVFRLTARRRYRAVFGAAIVGIIGLIWAEAAVQIF